jgi:hypothetical protein
VKLSTRRRRRRAREKRDQRHARRQRGRERRLTARLELRRQLVEALSPWRVTFISDRIPSLYDRVQLAEIGRRLPGGPDFG